MLSDDDVLRLLEQQRSDLIADYFSRVNQTEDLTLSPLSLQIIGFSIAKKNKLKGASWLRLAIDRSNFDPSIVANAIPLFSEVGYDYDIQKFYKCVAVFPNLPAHLFANFALHLESQEKYSEAERCYQKALQLEPSNQNFKAGLTSCLFKNKKFIEVVDLLADDTRLSSSHVLSVNFISALSELKRYQEIEEFLDNFPSLDHIPQETLLALSNAFNSRGDPIRALYFCEKALSVSINVKCLQLRGVIKMSLGQYKEAESDLRRALEVGKEQTQLIDYANCLFLQGDFHRVHELLQSKKVLQLKGKVVGTSRLSLLGRVNIKLGNIRVAIESLEGVFSVPPSELGETLAELYTLATRICDFDLVDRVLDKFSEAIDAGFFPFSPFQVLLHNDDPSFQKRYAESFTSFISSVNRRSLARNKHPGKVRLAYFSPDFRAHAVGYLMAELLSEHDTSVFEVILVTFGPKDDTELFHRLRRCASRVINLDEVVGEEQLPLLRDLELDIAVDLSGHTEHSRPYLFAAGVAPVHINYLGYPGTMGSTFHDYIIVDPVIYRNVERHNYSEIPLVLPRCYQPSDPRRYTGSRPSRADYGLPDNHFLFGCFNSSQKINRKIVRAWAKILSNCTDACLWLLGDQPDFKRNILNEFNKHGVCSTRIFFAERMSIQAHLSRHNLIDLMLDCFPYGAHTTANDCVWTGTPLLTIRGQSFASRVPASILSTANQQEFITDSMDEYVEKAILAYKNPGILLDARASLSLEKDRVGGLFDMKQYARDFEKLLLSTL